MPAVVWSEAPATLSVNEKGEREATRTFLVETNFNDNPIIAASAINIARFDSFPGDPTLFCQGASTKAVDDKTLGWWIVEIKYTSVLPESKGQNDPQSPKDGDQSNRATQRPWVISFGGVQVQEPLYPTDKDPFVDPATGIAGKPVVASNGQPFTPVIEVPSDHLTISITGFKDIGEIEPPVHHQTYHNKVNETPWGFGRSRYAARTLRVTKDDWQTQFDNGEFFWKFDITIEVKWDGWNPIRVIDRGTFERVSISQPLRPILIDGVPTKEPVPLDGSGRRLGPDLPLVYLEFQGYSEADFGEMI